MYHLFKYHHHFEEHFTLMKSPGTWKILLANFNFATERRKNCHICKKKQRLQCYTFQNKSHKHHFFHNFFYFLFSLWWNLLRHITVYHLSLRSDVSLQAYINVIYFLYCNWNNIFHIIFRTSLALKHSVFLLN